jgi:hypothetical protein
MLTDNQQQALEQILARASVDLQFRNQLLTDPRQAILSALGVRIPARFKLRFIEKDHDVDALVVLPEFRGQLGSAELDVVAGGTPGGDPGNLEPW